MKPYIAVVSHDAGTITKYQDFDTQAEADSHVGLYGGKVVTGITGEFEYWDVSGDTPVKDEVRQAADVVTTTAIQAIVTLEAAMTPRRLREHLDGTETGGWWTAQNALINAERSKL